MLSKQIWCNGSSVYFDASAWRKGKLALVPKTVSEQCEGCGEDIATVGVVDHDCVACDSCGQTYTAKDFEVEE